VRVGDGLRFGAAVSSELGPGPGKSSQLPIVIQHKSNDVLLFGLRVWFLSIFSETIERD
jgi:hypothetical protein